MYVLGLVQLECFFSFCIVAYDYALAYAFLLADCLLYSLHMRFPGATPGVYG
jgi:hypothetical protein